MKKKQPLRIIFSAGEIQSRVQSLGAEISRDYAQHELYVVGILKGAFIFLADLVRTLTIPCTIHFLKASSYGKEKVSSGRVCIEHHLDIRNKHVLLVEDIIDTGITLDRILQDLKTQEPASINICSLLDKTEARKIPVPVRYIGFTVPNQFLVGYGIDFAEKYRELPYIAIVD